MNDSWYDANEEEVDHIKVIEEMLTDTKVRSDEVFARVINDYDIDYKELIRVMLQEQEEKARTCEHRWSTDYKSPSVSCFLCRKTYECRECYKFLENGQNHQRYGTYKELTCETCSNIISAKCCSACDNIYCDGYCC